MAFEQLMAEATAKREKKVEKENKKSHRHTFTGGNRHESPAGKTGTSS